MCSQQFLFIPIVVANYFQLYFLHTLFLFPLSFRLARHLPPLPLSALAYPIHLPISPLPVSAPSFACAHTPLIVPIPLPLRVAPYPSVLWRRIHCIAPSLYVSPPRDTLCTYPAALSPSPYPWQPFFSPFPLATPYRKPTCPCLPLSLPLVVSPLWYTLFSTLMHAPCHPATLQPFFFPLATARSPMAILVIKSRDSNLNGFGDLLL